MPNSQYHRVQIFYRDAILWLISNEIPLRFAGRRIKTTTPRLRTYLKGHSCVACKRVGQFFALEVIKNFSSGDEEKTKAHLHLNLYAIDPKTGDEVLMTSDHIHPKSRGGKGPLINRQPMCAPCNTRKADKLPPP